MEIKLFNIENFNLQFLAKGKGRPRINMDLQNLQQNTFDLNESRLELKNGVEATARDVKINVEDLRVKYRIRTNYTPCFNGSDLSRKYEWPKQDSSYFAVNNQSLSEIQEGRFIKVNPCIIDTLKENATADVAIESFSWTCTQRHNENNNCIHDLILNDEHSQFARDENIQNITPINNATELKNIRHEVYIQKIRFTIVVYYGNGKQRSILEVTVLMSNNQRQSLEISPTKHFKKRVFGKWKLIR